MRGDSHELGSLGPIEQRDLGARSAAIAVGSVGSGTVNISVGPAKATDIKAVQPAVSAKLRPNLTICGFRNTTVTVEPWPFSGVHEPVNRKETEAAIKALVVKVENDLWEDGTGKKALNVLARIVYRPPSGSSVRIDYGVWMNAGIRFETLDIGETRELVLCLQTEEDFTVFEDKRDLNTHFQDPFAWFRPETMPEIASAEVTLVELRSQAKYVFDLGITRSDRQLEVALRT